MPILQIQFADGTTRDMPLVRNQPVSVGRHSTSDIQIDEDSVGILHCRISWNRRHWEVTAASADGVEVNGTIVRVATLTDNDLIRVGSVDLRLLPETESFSREGSSHRGSAKSHPPSPLDPDSSPLENISRESTHSDSSRPTYSPEQAALSEVIPLRPLTEDEIVYPLELVGPETTAAEPAEPSAHGPSGETLLEDPADPDDEEQIGSESFADDSRAEPHSAADGAPGRRHMLKRRPSFDSDSEPEHEDEEFEEDAGQYADAEAESGDVEADESASKQQKPPESLLRQARHSRREKRPRPGERETLRSPLVLGLGGGVLALLLGAATLWFTIGRQQSNQQYSRALELLNSSQFARAATAFQQILDERPNGRFSQEARIGLGRAKIGQRIGSAPADWDAGLAELESFIRQQRDLAGFAELKPYIQKYARDISAGAATSAGQRASRSLLETSTAAERLALQYAEEDSRTAEFLADMTALRRNALREIRRHEALTAALKEITRAIKAQEPMAALTARRDLVARWPDLETHAEVRRLLQQTLETEQSLVQRAEPGTAASSSEPAAGPPVTVLARHTRARTDEVSDGTIVIAATRRSCFGIDLMTGTPVWRKTIGDDLAFFPLEATSVVPGLLLYEAGKSELQLVRKTTGAILWRLPLTSRPQGAPLLHEGQIYLATAAGELLQIDLHAGTLAAKLSFSQPVVGPPALLEDGGHLLLPGEQEVLYLLSLRPLEIRQVHLLEHQAGAISAPVLQMGRLVLLAANDRAGSSRLYAFRTPLPEQNSRLEPFSLRIPGHVLDQPVLRGRQLFVTSSGERISAFSVTDDPAAEPLTLLASYQPQSERTAALHLLAGTDGQIWMAGTVLRRLQLEAEQIVTEGTTGGDGSASQPLRLTSGQLLFGRRQGSSEAVLFSRVDAESLAGRWRVVLGAQPRLLHPLNHTEQSATAVSTQPSAAESETHQGLIVTGDGSIYRLEPGQQPASLEFHTQPVTALPVGDRLQSPLVTAALAAGRIAVAAAKPDPVLWIINQSGRIERTVRLPSPVECSPVEISAGVVVPVAGLLRVFSPSEAPAVEDFLSPLQNNEQLRWQQLLATASDELLTIDSQQTLQRLQLRQEPSPHLARVTSLKLEDRTDVPAAAADGFLYLAAATGRLLVFDAATLEQRRAIQLPAPPRGPVYLDGNMVFVEVEGNRLCAIATGDRAEAQPAEAVPLWTMPLLPGGLAGPPHVQAGAVWLAAADGTVQIVDQNTGALLKTSSAGERLAGGVVECGGQLLVAGQDGVIVHLGPSSQPLGPLPGQEPAP